MKSLSSLLSMTMVTLMGLVSCSDSSEITVYSIPKEKSSNPPSPKVMSEYTKDISEYVSEVKLGDHPAHLVQAENQGQAIRIYVVKFDENSWYFKLIGDAHLAQREKENFDAFVRSFEFRVGSPPPDPKTVSVPTGWKPGKVSSMRLGSYSVEEEDGCSLDISITSFPGDLGGLMPNVERWLGQISLKPGITPK